jgi:hypothetical protein
MKTTKLITLALLALCVGGCAVVTANRTFPKLAWYWSTDAQEQRREQALEKQYNQSVTNNPTRP